MLSLLAWLHTVFLQQLEQHSYNLHQKPMCLYGNPAHAQCVHIQGPFSRET